MLLLKEAVYNGFHKSLPATKFVYLIYGPSVYFSGLGKDNTSTINAAEEIVRIICTLEDIDWKVYTFFDVQTFRGYPGKRPGKYSIDKLMIRDNPYKEGCAVIGWNNVVASASDRFHYNNNSLPTDVIPTEVFQTFVPLIYSDDV